MYARISIAVSLILAGATLTGCSAAAKPEPPKTFDIAGTITIGLGNVTRSYAPEGAGCQGTVTLGLEDMVGMQILAYDSDGKIAKTGRIGKGTVRWEKRTDVAFDGSTEQANCELRFSIKNTPKSSDDLYQIRIKGLSDSDYLSASELQDVALHPLIK